MNAILIEIYSTILPSMPFIIAAYVLIWAVVFVWLFLQFKKQNNIAQRLDLLEDCVAEKNQVKQEE